MNAIKNDDQSDYLIHLVGKENPYETFMRILSSGKVCSKNSFGYKKECHKKNSICFSEIPPKFLKKLVNRRYNYGIVFKKDWLLKVGAQRVWYVEKDSKEHISLTHLSNNLSGLDKEYFFDLAPFIDIPGEYGSSRYRFEWEREWRIIGDLSFAPDDVAFLILPCDVHEHARSFFADAEEEQVGPNYDCPYYDPLKDQFSNKK
ncbi:hypothetical protein OA92_07020 [Marinomonas sp. SBI22]|uniref:abortive infection system antitoxin AbiGi family protein n=1 Tax=unclassified Marinomonas TaxID=196814 RepID=UPI0007AF6C3D|nr:MULTISPECIES: abortive infection system antitoxin AbiGi family protein [unclassified Marinomonas]KZM44403.1 hypothetical protein OA92_07020 [Marinomonas sp. SBI22]KZM45561.1 hypothetical protein OA91_08165 [Marinomonas sp. SBI8L]